MLLSNVLTVSEKYQGPQGLPGRPGGAGVKGQKGRNSALRKCLWVVVYFYFFIILNFHHS